MKIEEQLANKSLQVKIEDFKNHIITNLCSDLPNAFWHRKKHIVTLPYSKDFSESQIPTKARPIQMSLEDMELCKQEISELLNKNIIRKSKSPWSCPTFYVRKK